MKIYVGNREPATIYGKSTETKPTTGIEDGTSFVEVDTKKIYIFCDGTWYEQ